MLKRSFIISLAICILVNLSCLRVGAVNLNNGAYGCVDVDLDEDSKTIIFTAGAKTYYCNCEDKSYRCTDETSGHFRNFIPFINSNGDLPKNYMSMIRVAIIFYTEDYKLTYLTDGTVIKETYIDNSCDLRTNEKTKGKFVIYSSIDPLFEAVKGETYVEGSTYYWKSGFGEENFIEKNQNSWFNPSIAKPQTIYKVDLDNPGEGLNFFSINLSGSIGLISRMKNEKNKDKWELYDKLNRQQIDQIYNLFQISGPFVWFPAEYEGLTEVCVDYDLDARLIEPIECE